MLIHLRAWLIFVRNVLKELEISLTGILAVVNVKLDRIAFLCLGEVD
jgi:hypothetical protein